MGCGLGAGLVDGAAGAGLLWWKWAKKCFLMGSQIFTTVSKSIPCPMLPESDSPLSFSKTLLYFKLIEVFLIS